jgi:hypothetical protein
LRLLVVLYGSSARVFSDDAFDRAFTEPPERIFMYRLRQSNRNLRHNYARSRLVASSQISQFSAVKPGVDGRYRHSGDILAHGASQVGTRRVTDTRAARIIE